MNKIYVFLVAMLLFISCIKETGIINETVIENKSGYNVSLTAYGNRQEIVIALEKGEKASETRENDTGGAAIFPMDSDSVIIVFNNTHIVKYYNALPPFDRSPYSINNYSKESLGKKNGFDRYIYTYTITEEDFNNAILIAEPE